MAQKRSLENNLSHALREIFESHGVEIFSDKEKLFTTLRNLIPNLYEELDAVKFALDSNAVSILVDAIDKKDIDKSFAYLRAKTILLKNGISEKAVLYIIDCFLYAFDWTSEFPDFEDISDSDFRISPVQDEVVEEEASDSSDIDEEVIEEAPVVTEEENIETPAILEEAVEIKEDIPTTKEEVSDDIKQEEAEVVLEKASTDTEKVEEEIPAETIEEIVPVEEEPIKEEESENIASNIEDTIEEIVVIGDLDEKAQNIEETKLEEVALEEKSTIAKNEDKKYYLSHDFDDDDDDYYDDDDYEYSTPIFKKVLLVILPLIVVCVIGLFVFKHFNSPDTEPDIIDPIPVLSEVTVDEDSEYEMDENTYVLPIGEEVELTLLVESDNSEELDLSKLEFEIENPDLCEFEVDGMKCKIKGLEAGKTRLIVLYDGGEVDNIKIEFKDLSKTEPSTENNNTQPEDNQPTTPPGGNTGGNTTGGETGGNTGGGETGGNTGGGTTGGETGGNTGGGTTGGETGGNAGGGTTGGETGGELSPTE